MKKITRLIAAAASLICAAGIFCSSYISAEEEREYALEITMSDNEAEIMNYGGETVKASAYIAMYDDNVLIAVLRRDIEIPPGRYVMKNVPAKASVYLWDGGLKPLAKKWEFVPEPTPTPEPTSTPKPTPASTPLPLFVVREGVLVEYTGIGGDVEVPETVDGQTITAIGSRAFAGNGSLTHIALPDTVETIDSVAFRNCEWLSSVKLSAQLKTLGMMAFESCASLREIDLPDTLREIQSNTFSGCDSLKKVTLPSELTYIGDSAFADCISLNTELVIPDTVTEIGRKAFYGIYFDSVTLGAGCASIGRDAFTDVDVLKVYNTELSENLPDCGEMYGYANSAARGFAADNNIPFYDIETGELLR